MNPQTQPTDQPDPTMRWAAIAAYALVFAAGFWVIDHTPGASDYFKQYSLIAETDNRTADRIESVNLITAPVRIMLGLAGIGFLLLPVRKQLNWGGLVLLLMLTYLGYMGTSAIWSIHPGITVQKFLVLTCFGVAAFGLARQLEIKELAFMFSMICLIYIFVGMLAEIALGNFTPYTTEYRFVGTCHPNSLAVYGSFCCLTAMVYFGKKPRFKHWLVLLFAIGFVTLLMTKSRTTLAGFGFACLATLFLTFKPHHRVLAFSATMLMLVVIGMTLTLSRSNVRAATADSLAMGRTEDVSSLTGRLPLWEELIVSIEKKPLQGYGYLAFWNKEKIEFLSDVFKWEIPHGHNMYLDVLLDGGIIGLIIYVSVFLVAVAIAAYRSIVYLDHDMSLVFGFLVFAIIHGFAESLFKLPTFLLFMLVTLVLRMAFEPALSAPKTNLENGIFDTDLATGATS